MKNLFLIILVFFSLDLKADPIYPNTHCSSLAKDFAPLLATYASNPVKKEGLRLFKIFGSATKGSQNLSPEVVKEILLSLKTINDADQLKVFLAGLVHEIKKSPYGAKLPASMTELEMTEMLNFMFDQELTCRGLGRDPSVKALKEWTQLDTEMTAHLDASGTHKIADLELIQSLEKIADSKFLSLSRLKVLNQAQEALQIRIEKIKSAKKSIHIMTWAMYGDHAGDLFADLLIKKKQEGLDVKVMVDYITAQKPGYKESVQKLKLAGIPVIEWRGITNPYFGQHRKNLLIDVMEVDASMIGGGRNLGDVYLHMGGLTKAKWTDFDIYVESEEAVLANETLMGQLWNEQIDFQKLSFEKIDLNSIQAKIEVLAKKLKNSVPNNNPKSNSVMLINHSPGGDGVDLVEAAFLKLIRSSQSSIFIENAYVILTPSLKRELIAAHARGVKVQVFSNSMKSVDEPIVSVPIAKSLKELFEAGIEVFIKKGDTLHTKLAVFDDLYSIAMSYNLHPRSKQLEGEMAQLLYGQNANAEFRASIATDLKDAIKVSDTKDLGIPEDTNIIDVITQIFFNAL